jgi:hypothetical protein
MGVAATVPLRLVRERIRYEDLGRQPYTPPFPDHHHRNETLTGIGDPQVVLHLGREEPPWTLAAWLGVSVPLGRTEENPFELGRQGRPHQHIQFGTGSWGQVLGAGAGLEVAGLVLQLEGTALLQVAENRHGYRPGERFTGTLSAQREVVEHWFGVAGTTLHHEETETWDGVVEEEGNLGRTDLMLMLAIGRALGPIGSVGLRAQIPLASRVSGEQAHNPWIISLSWAR